MATTVEQCLTRAMRMNGTKAEGEAMTAAEADDGLLVFNQTVRGMFGRIIGVKLETYAGSTTTARHGAMYEVGGAAYTLTAPANPRDGWRWGWADRGSLATNNLTVNPNSQKIDAGTANLTINTLNDNRVYWFRGDTGNWEKERDLLLTDNAYFPDEMVGYLTAIVAQALCTEYGRDPSEVVKALANAGLDAFKERYGRRGMPRAASPAAA